MTSSLTKSKARVKALGEVFTPPELVNEMLDRLPHELWTDPSKTYIDPACGTGNFLVEVVRRKIEAGSTPLQALETTYGIDIMEDNVLECRQRLLGAAGSPSDGEQVVTRRIRCADALAADLDKLFTEAKELQ
jgi:SAM-dependent methyltransferase